jgi:hypothetical protein
MPFTTAALGGFGQGAIIDPLKLVANLGIKGALAVGAIDQKTANMLAQKEQEYQQQYTNAFISPGQDVASNVGRIVGGVYAGSKIPVGRGAGGPVAEFISSAVAPVAKLVKPLAAGAAYGSAYAAAENNPASPEYVEKIKEGAGLGAVTGAGATLLGKGIVKAVGTAAPAVVNATKNFAQDFRHPEQRFLRKIAGGKEKQLLAKLNAPEKEYVKGQTGTAAEIAPNVATFSAGQAELVKKYGANAMEEANVKRASDLSEELNELAGNDYSRAKAIETRIENKKINFEPVDKQTVVADAKLYELTSRPLMKEVFARAKKISENAGKSFGIQPRKVAAQGGLTRKVPPREYTGEDITTLKTALDDMMGDEKYYGERRSINKLKEDLVSWADAKLPGYKEARAGYAKDSRAIDQQTVGRYLQDALEGNLDEARITPEKFDSAIENARLTLKRSTGENRYKSLEELFGAEKWKKIENVRQEIYRRAKYEGKAKAGGGADVNVNEKVKKLAMINRFSTVLNFILDVTHRRMTKDMAESMARKLIDPKTGEISADFSKVIAENDVRSARALLTKKFKINLEAKAESAEPVMRRVRGNINALWTPQQPTNNIQ